MRRKEVCQEEREIKKGSTCGKKEEKQNVDLEGMREEKKNKLRNKVKET